VTAEIQWKGKDRKMPRYRYVGVLMLLSLLVACAESATPTVSSSPTHVSSPAPPVTATAAPSATSAVTQPPTATSVATPQSIATQTRTPTPIHIPSATPTRKPTRTFTPAPEPTPTRLSELFRRIVAVGDVLPGVFSRLYPAPDGALWLVTDQGVAQLVDDEWSVFLTGYDGAPVGVDAHGRFWALNEDSGEISAWDGMAWKAYSESEGWTSLGDSRNREVRGATSDKLGQFWVTTPKDVRVFDGVRWHVLTPDDVEMGEFNYQDLLPRAGIEVLSSGDVWLSECEWAGPGPVGGQGVRWFDGTSWHGADSPVASGCSLTVEEGSSGRVWVGMDDHVWRYDPTTADWESFTPTEPPPFDAVRYGAVTSIVLDPSGEPWVTFLLCGGASCDTEVLLHLHDGVWIQITDRPGISGRQRLVFDGAGTAWLFWDGGVYRIVDGVPELVGDLYIRHVTQDAAQQVWFVAGDRDQEVLWALTTNSGD
jgi:hypothetical protein